MFYSLSQATYLNQDEGENELDVVKQVLSEECPEETESNHADQDIEADAAPEVSTQPPPAKKKRTLGNWLGTGEDTAETTGQRKSKKVLLKEEVVLYASTPVIDCNSDPLRWWYSHATTYPVMASFARKYLCIQATSSPSERLFSKAGSVITPNRANLNPDKASMLVFLSENL